MHVCVRTHRSALYDIHSYMCCCVCGGVLHIMIYTLVYIHVQSSVLSRINTHRSRDISLQILKILWEGSYSIWWVNSILSRACGKDVSLRAPHTEASVCRALLRKRDVTTWSIKPTVCCRPVVGWGKAWGTWMCCSVIVCCSGLQCVAVRSSVLHGWMYLCMYVYVVLLSACILWSVWGSWMDVHVHACMHVRVHVCVCAVRVHVCVCAVREREMNSYMSVRMYICSYMWRQVWMYTCMYLYWYVCMVEG